jgi:hypothetical protein
MSEGDSKESLDKFLPGNPAISIDVQHVKDAVDFGVVDAETGLQLEVIDEFAELRQVDVIVFVFVVFAEDVVDGVAHQLLFRLLVPGHLHGRIGLSKCIIRFADYRTLLIGCKWQEGSSDAEGLNFGGKGWVWVRNYLENLNSMDSILPIDMLST